MLGVRSPAHPFRPRGFLVAAPNCASADEVLAPFLLPSRACARLSVRARSALGGAADVPALPSIPSGEA